MAFDVGSEPTFRFVNATANTVEQQIFLVVNITCTKKKRYPFSEFWKAGNL